MNPRLAPRRLAALGALLAVTLVWSARAEGPSTEAYEKDATLLSSKIAQHRYRLKRTKDGESRLSDLESALSALRSRISELKDAASDIGTVDSHLRYLRTMEIEPKQREIERVKSQAESDLESFRERGRSLQSRVAQHNAANRQFGEGEEAALAAYNAEAAQLNQERDALSAQFDERRQYWQQSVEAAILACAKVQQEFVEHEEKRRAAVEKYQAHHEAYNGARGPLVESLSALDREPEPANATAAVPLTPFSRGVSSGEAPLVPAKRPPVGPGSPRALDQLRIVVASSTAGEQQQAEVTAKTDLGYTFDTPGGVGKADLPDVETPMAESEALAEPEPDRSVPLVVPEPTAPVQASPVAQASAQRQSENFSKLEQLYQQRRELARQGPQASAQAWGEVVQQISLTQSKINLEGVTQKLTEGSADIDLTIRHKSQRKPVEVPSPVGSEKK